MLKYIPDTLFLGKIVCEMREYQPIELSALAYAVHKNVGTLRGIHMFTYKSTLDLQEKFSASDYYRHYSEIMP